MNLRHGFLTTLYCGFLASVVACGSSGKQQGVEGGPCYGNGTCNEGLVCLSETCVSPHGNQNPGGTGGGSNGLDVSQCLSCGNSACSAEADACAATNGCSDLLECWLAYAGDTACANACDVSNVTTEDLGKVSEYFACIVPACVSECTPTVSGGGGTGGSNSGTGGSNSGTGGVSGGGDPCDTVTPSNTCLEGSAYVMQQVGNGFSKADPTEMKLTVAGDVTQATWFLESSQMGVIEYRFSEPVDPSEVIVSQTGGAISEVSMETADGLGGRRYVIISNRLERVVTYDEELFDVNYWGCWGTLEGPDTELWNEPTNTSVIKLQTEVTPAPKEYKVMLNKLTIR